MGSTIDTLVAQIDAIAGVTAKNGHIYKSVEVPQYVLVTLTGGDNELAAANNDERYVETDFNLECHALTADNLETLKDAVIDKVLAYTASNLSWEINGLSSYTYTRDRSIQSILGTEKKVTS